MEKIILFGLITALVFVSGCTSTQNGVSVSHVEQLCVSRCQAYTDAGTDMTTGPCISNIIAPDWSCDVVHNPRTTVDDLPANQCPVYGVKTHHVVEVDTNCKLVRTV